jgi:hypothetical protein
MMMDGDVEKEISPNDDAWKVFLCRLSRRRWSEKATTLTFFHDFLVKPPHRKWLLLLLFDKTTQTRNYNFLKHATQNVAGDILVSKVGFRRLMNHIYIYTTSPLQRRETSTRVTSRSSSFL